MTSAASRTQFLEAGLAEVTGARAARLGVRATGGLSQETWLATLDPDGAPQQVVLRVPTAGSGARSIATQRRALELAHRHSIPVPGLLAADEGSANPLGTPYLVMNHVAGEIPAGWNDLEPQRRHTAALEAMQILARVHAITGDEVAAGGLRVPKQSAAADELEFYRRRFAGFGVSRRGTVEVAFRWLEANLPARREPVLTHNDFRMGNFVLSGQRIAAVLDWELAAGGDPPADLAWCFIAVWDPAEVDTAALLEAYAQASGCSIAADELRWYSVMGYLRLLYYSLSAGSAFGAGTAHDLRLAALRLLGPMRLDRLLRAVHGSAPV